MLCLSRGWKDSSHRILLYRSFVKSVIFLTAVKLDPWKNVYFESVCCGATSHVIAIEVDRDLMVILYYRQEPPNFLVLITNGFSRIAPRLKECHTT